MDVVQVEESVLTDPVVVQVSFAVDDVNHMVHDGGPAAAHHEQLQFSSP